MASGPTKYYRRDQKAGITPPDMTCQCSYAEHIVRARGKKSRFTSMSLDPAKIKHDFGEALYELKRPAADKAGHLVIEHPALMAELHKMAKNNVKEDKLRALAAIHHARRRAEGLVDWALDVSTVPAKNRFKWTANQIRPYFTKKG